MGRSFRDTIREQMSDASFREAWEETEPEYLFAKALLKARREAGITQQELAERTGISQADISRMEGAQANPSLKSMQRIARGLGKHLVIGFS